jgi:hypothetical protein
LTFFYHLGDGPLSCYEKREPILPAKGSICSTD